MDKTLSAALKAIEILQAQVDGADAVVKNWQDIADGYRKENKRLKKASRKTFYLVWAVGFSGGLLVGLALGLVLN